MSLRLWSLGLLLSAGCAWSQQPAIAPPSPSVPALDDTPAPPLPDIKALLLQVEANQRAAEALQAEYTYHVFFQSVEVDKNGNPKKTESNDFDSLTVDGVRINRLTAKNGKPLSPDEARKESERVDKSVEKEKAHRAELAAQGKPSNSRGEGEVSVSRILELGTLSNLRIAELDGRRAFVADYTGDPNAKTHAAVEGIFRDLVGTLWIDDQDRELMRVQGHFNKDFKIGAGLVLDLRKDTSFDAHFIKVDNEVWLLSSADAQGKFSYLLFGGFNGNAHYRVSDYKKFRTTTTLHPIGPDGQPLPTDPPDH